MVIFCLLLMMQEPPQWNGDIVPQALLEAQKQGVAQKKNILVAWKNDWCPGCHAFQKLLTRNGLREWLEETSVFIEIHCEKGEGVALAKALDIKGWPHFTIHDRHSLEIIHRFAGFESDELLRKKILHHMNGITLEEKELLHQNNPQETLAAELGEYWMFKGQYDKAYAYFQQAMALSATPKRYWQEHLRSVGMRYYTEKISLEAFKKHLYQSLHEAETPEEKMSLFEDAYLLFTYQVPEQISELLAFEPLIQDLNPKAFPDTVTGNSWREMLAFYRAEKLMGKPDQAYSYLIANLPENRDHRLELEIATFLRDQQVLPDKREFHLLQSYEQCPSEDGQINRALHLARLYFDQKKLDLSAEWIKKAESFHSDSATHRQWIQEAWDRIAHAQAGASQDP